MSTYVCNTPIPESEQHSLSIINGVIGGNKGVGDGSAINNNIIHHDNFHQQQQNLLDDITNSSIIEFLNQENQCYDVDTASEIEIESIFEEINRLSGGGGCENGIGYTNTADTSISISDVNVEDILKEAERLITKQAQLEIPLSAAASTATILQKCNSSSRVDHINLQSQKSLSSESTPREMKKGYEVDKIDNEILDLTNCTEKLDLNIPHNIHDDNALPTHRNSSHDSYRSNRSSSSSKKSLSQTASLYELNNSSLHQQSIKKSETTSAITTTTSHLPRRSSFDNYVANNNRPYTPTRTDSRCSTPLKGQYTFVKSSKSIKPVVVDRPSPAPSPTPSMMSSSTSFCRERNLEKEIDQLQEKLKDTEERLQSLRLQHDSLSQVHRVLRDNQSQYREESDRCKIEIQHLTDCASKLRSELQSARADRSEALELQKILQKEVEESRAEKRKAVEQTEKDVKIIQDLQRQCKEMERILMRKHPDSVSALIVASKNGTSGGLSSSASDKSFSRNLLEQRIAQLESDAKEQDNKSQQILANVQTRFSAVQSKYEQHIGDLETQVLSLQQINAGLNEQIEQQLKLMTAVREPPIVSAIFTQTGDNELGTMNHGTTETLPIDTSAKSTQTDFKSNVKSTTTATKKIKNESSDSHLMATLRGMRVDLAIKEKGMQRLTKELDECKKTIRKLHKENEVALRADRLITQSATTSKKTYNPALYSEQSADAMAIKELSNKLKLLECDYSALHNKRLQDLKTLQAAHDRELSSCHETVHILQQRLTERDAAIAMQSRRKVPVDYLALKSKVSSLERRHSEREERLHLLVEALSKGRLHGVLDSVIS